jgi:hypothetical protein
MARARLDFSSRTDPSSWRTRSFRCRKKAKALSERSDEGVRELLLHLYLLHEIHGLVSQSSLRTFA